MSVKRREQLEVDVNDLRPSSPGQAEPRQTTLSYPTSSTPSNPTSPSTPSSPTPFLGPSYPHDLEQLDDQCEEKGFMPGLRRRLGLYSDITYHTQVPRVIRAVSEYQPGYGRVAAVENCDPSFLIYRRFGWLHSRLLLNLQDELQKLERDLERDEAKEFNYGQPIKLKARRKDCKNPDAVRPLILASIHEKLKEYDELLFRLRDVQALKRPSNRNQGSLYQEVKRNIVDAENEWILQSDDLAAVAQDAEHGWFNVALESFLNSFSRKALFAIFRHKDQKLKTGSMPYMNLVDPKRFDVLLKAILTIIASVLLLAPVFILFEIQPTTPSQVKDRGRKQMIVVLLFTLTFSACCSIFTKARKQEVFTATAAYSAVLVVFLGNASNMVACPSSG